MIHALPVGGAEVCVAQLARHLAHRGEDVEVGCLDSVGILGERLRAQGIPVVSFARRPGKDLSVAWRIAAHLRRTKVDVVHAHQIPAYVYGSLARVLYPVPLIFTEHGRHLPDVASRARRLFNAWFEPRIARSFAVSETVKEALVRVEGFPPARIEVLRNGVDLDRFHVEPDSLELRRCFGIPANVRVVGSVGRLDAAKNHRVLLRALHRLRVDMPDVHLAIVGDGPERRNLEMLAQNLELTTRVHFLGERHDVERLLPMFGVFALGSLNEGTPLTVLEAMAAGKAIVATAVGGVPEILTHEEDALLVDLSCTSSEPSLEERFASAIQRVLRHEELRDRLGRSARSRAVREHSEAAVCERYRKTYKQLLERST